MYCPNCGAFYPGEKEYHCPYCLSENPNMVAKKRAEILKEYDVDERKLSETMYEERSKKISKKLGRTLLTAFIVFASVVVIIILGIFAIAAIGKNQEKKITEELEAYFQQEDWEGMQIYIRGHHISGTEYDKYTEFSIIYGQYELMYMFYDNILAYAQTGAEVDWNSETGSELKADMNETIAYAYKAYRFGKADMEDMAILGNEAAINGLLQEIVDLFESYGVTEEELAYLASCDLGDPDTEKIDEISTRILEQMFETK